MDFFISDTHFGHGNILGYDVRPFRTVEEMDRELTYRWNAAVGKDDHVYILGDFVWSWDLDRAASVVSSLTGHKHLVVGNHDKVFTDNAKLFIESENLLDEIVPYKELSIEGRPEKIVLSHYPMPFFNGLHRKWYHFYGHVHSTPEWLCCENLRKAISQHYQYPVRFLNVGCMMSYMGYTPRTLQELSSQFAESGTQAGLQQQEKKGKVHGIHAH